MAKQLTMTQSRRRLVEIVGEVAAGTGRYLITRRGRAVAALVSVEDLRRLEEGERPSTRPGGALALAGLWANVPDAEIDALVDRLQRERDKARQRTVGDPPRSTEPRG